MRTFRSLCGSPAALRHVFALALLVCGFLVALVHGQEANTLGDQPTSTRSLAEQWLAPQTVIGTAVFLLYVGELRGDIRRTKRDLIALQDKLEDKYMTKETIEAKLATVDAHRQGHRG